MAKTLNLAYDGKEYTLEYTRETVKQMERRGFKINDVLEKPLTSLPELFFGAFRANHPFVKREATDEILENMEDVEGLIAALCEMYNEPLETLMMGASADEGNEGKAVWAASWTTKKAKAKK